MSSIGFAALLSIVTALACRGYDGTRPEPILAVVGIVVLDQPLVAGGTTRGFVILTDVATAGAAAVTLSSSNTNVATVPGSVLVPEGYASADFTVTAVSSGSAVITWHFGASRTRDVTVTPAPRTMVDFRHRGLGTLASGQDCEVSGVELDPGVTMNHMRCNFDGSLSIPRTAITRYIWRFPQTPELGIATVTTDSPFLGSRHLAFGSFGTGAVGTSGPYSLKYY
jgi:hypothetical protein